MVVTGVIVGNGGRALAMSDLTRRYIDLFWELIDEILNAALFVLIGMEVVLVAFSIGIFAAAAAAIVLTLAVRGLTVGIPVALMKRSFKLANGSGWVLTWGGLRGGISVALALSLPVGPHRDLVLAITHCVVVFSILCQGLTLGRVIRAALPRRAETPPV
jgi:CPA1 family monovalent cation:H+ antiporter